MAGAVKTKKSATESISAKVATQKSSDVKEASRTRSQKVRAPKKEARGERVAPKVVADPTSVAPVETTSGARRPVGRPKGSGKYGEPVKTVRIPISLVNQIDAFIERKGNVVRLYGDLIQAGFPSPAADAPFEPLDLGEYLIPNPNSTFFIKATGESMRDAGIFPGDVLIVDRSLEAFNGDVVVAAVDGEFTVKRLFKTSSRLELRPENCRFPPIPIGPETDLKIWGVVKRVIHNL